jgi:PleD family two-component response regulator
MITHPRNKSPLPPALALLVGSNDWSVRAIESILDPAAYLTLRAPNTAQALQLAQSASPDVVIVYGDLLDQALEDVCRAMTRENLLSPSCPFIVLASNGGTREHRLELQRLGVWYVLNEPIDAEALGLFFTRLLGAQRELRRVTERIFMDAETGMYNERGLLRRATEIGAHATRNREPLAFVVLRPVIDRDDPPADRSTVTVATLSAHLADIVGRIIRMSDVAGWLRPREIGIVATGANAEAAITLVDRLRTAVESSPLVIGGAIRRLSIEAALCALPDFADSAVGAPDLLMRVAEHLRTGIPIADRAPISLVEAIPLRR